MISRRGFGLETVGSFQSLITRITHGDEPWGFAVPPHHDPAEERLVCHESKDGICNLIKLDERFGDSAFFALLRREAVPILLGARRRDPTRHQAIHANVLLIA